MSQTTKEKALSSSPKKRPAAPKEGKRNPDPILIKRDDFVLQPGKYAKMSSNRQLVKIIDKSGEVICVYGGRL